VLSIEKNHILCFWRFEQKKSAFSTLDTEQGALGGFFRAERGYGRRRRDPLDPLKKKGKKSPLAHCFFFRFFALCAPPHFAHECRLFQKSF
jgi:hypothetical protein